jgi:hypothetical protein
MGPSLTESIRPTRQSPRVEKIQEAGKQKIRSINKEGGGCWKTWSSSRGAKPLSLPFIE